jgi:hypothetical protein
VFCGQLRGKHHYLAENVLRSVDIFNLDSGYSLVEPTPQSPYNARALNEDETRAAIGKGS